MGMHVGRSFNDTRLEDVCICPKEPCGLVDLERVWGGGCEQHDLKYAKTLRQGHKESECPGAKHNL